MSKLVLITGFTPTIDNYRGPSAMMYHFLKARPRDCEVKVFSLNGNGVPLSMMEASERELNLYIKILKDDFYNFFHRRHTLADLRLRLGIDKYYGESNYRLTKTVLKEIDDFSPDFVWIYGEDKTSIIKQLSNRYKVLVAGYDCFALHFNRLLKDKYCYRTPNRYIEALHRYKIALSREVALIDVPCSYFDVGIEDRNMFETITGRKDAKFYPHPHYTVFPKKVNFNKDKLSILISGKLDEYTWSDAMKLQQVFCENKSLNEHFSVTILGKGWEEYANVLITAGYNVEVKAWVDVYADEVVKHDIQIFPISVGSGTKGKVLDALCMGLLCIGSKIAMENIYVSHGKSCYQYDTIEDIPNILNNIYAYKNQSSEIAENGRKQVLKWHNPERIMNLILQDMLDDGQYDAISEYNENK